jgi:hypothetical protein
MRILELETALLPVSTARFYFCRPAFFQHCALRWNASKLKNNNYISPFF